MGYHQSKIFKSVQIGYNELLMKQIKIQSWDIVGRWKMVLGRAKANVVNIH